MESEPDLGAAANNLSESMTELSELMDDLSD